MSSVAVCDTGPYGTSTYGCAGCLRGITRTSALRAIHAASDASGLRLLGTGVSGWRVARTLSYLGRFQSDRVCLPAADSSDKAALRHTMSESVQ
jgi:hypothetical protein